MRGEHLLVYKWLICECGNCHVGTLWVTLQSISICTNASDSIHRHSAIPFPSTAPRVAPSSAAFHKRHLIDLYDRANLSDNYKLLINN